MAGNRDVYEQAMNAGDSAAWDQEWPQAIESYMTALREFPSSKQACNSLGLALFNAGRLEDAYKVYNQSHKLDPDDPLPVEKSADILERMGRVTDAAKQYLTVAEIYLGQHDLEKAIANWERATQITPGMIQIHKKLAMAYERTGQKVEAINEYLKLAFNFQKAGKGDVAMQALQRALRIDSKEPRLLNAITAVRNNAPISPDLLEAPDSADGDADGDSFLDFDINAEVADSDARGPMGDAIEFALEQLAASVFESGNMGMAEASAMQGIEMQRANITDEAIAAYRMAVQNGMSSPALNMNLGALLVENEEWEAALTTLQSVSGDDLLNAGSQHGIALSQLGLGNWKASATSLIQTLRLVDLALVIDESEADELNQLYHQLSGMVEQTDDQTLKSLSERLAEMLTGPDWKRRVAQTRARLSEIIGKDSQHVIEDLAKGEEVIDAMNQIDEWIANKRYNLAMDEVHYILEKEPDYLAAHLKIAEIMMEQSRVQQAITKYNWIARTYLMRGDENKAADILDQVIKVAPADIALRQNLLELLEQQERWDEMVDQYLDLANTYRNLGDLGNARSAVDQANKLVQRMEMSVEKQVAVMHKLGEIDMERVEMRGALRTYQKIAELAPSDTDARRKLVDLYYRLNNSAQGIQEVDQLLQMYARQQRADLIVALLEDLILDYPDDMGLRSRMAGVYQQMKQPAKALEHYQELRRLQNAAGLAAEAEQTTAKIATLQ